MKQDRLMRLGAVLCFVIGLFLLNAGRTISGAVILLLGAAILYSRPRGNLNERNLYDKIVKAPDVTIEGLYELFKDMDTPLGRCWIGEHKSLGNEVLVFGPGKYKDYIVVAKQKDKVVLKSTTELNDLTCDEERLSGIKDVTSEEVTPKDYSEFASYKLITAVLIEDILKLIEAYAKDETVKAPESADSFNLYHYNSPDFIVRDMEDNEYARCETFFTPSARVKIFDMDGEEIASVVANGETTKGRTPKDGFSVIMSGDEYGTMFRKGSGGADAFAIDTPDGTFMARAFPVVRKANVSCNYAVSLDGVRKALLAGNARIRFENDELSTNDMILSFDDDYLLFYIALQETIMASSNFLK